MCSYVGEGDRGCFCLTLPSHPRPDIEICAYYNNWGSTKNDGNTELFLVCTVEHDDSMLKSVVVPLS